MDAKLTLTIEQSVIDKAKEYAKGQGRSLSALIESYLKSLTSGEKIGGVNDAPLTKKLMGSVKIPEGFDYENALLDKLSEKYL